MIKEKRPSLVHASSLSLSRASVLWIKMPMVQNVDLIYLAGIGVFHLLQPHTWSVFLVLSTISTQIPVTCPFILCICHLHAFVTYVSLLLELGRWCFLSASSTKGVIYSSIYNIKVASTVYFLYRYIYSFEFEQTFKLLWQLFWTCDIEQDHCIVVDPEMQGQQ